MKLTNLVLARTGIAMKDGRDRFWEHNNYAIRLSNRFGKAEAGLWFRTRGCRHDLAGGCTMCDYSAGPDTTAEYMVECVKQGLEKLPTQLWHLLFSPSGSFLDTWEVPIEARRGILDLLGTTKYETFSFESRAETIIDDAIAECCIALNNRPLKIYLGLESANPWISKYSINKELSLSEFERAAQILADHQVGATANVILGSPFLSPAEAIEDTVRSVMWAFDKGATECCLFPTHVKRWTSLYWLYSQGLYKPPSLWSLVEVLRRLGPEIVSNKIELAWYTSYGAFNVESSPTTCPLCADQVIQSIDRFAESNDYYYIEKLIAMDCTCKDIWKQDLGMPDSNSILGRATYAYSLMGPKFVGESWWTQFGAKVLSEMYDEATASGLL